MKIFYIQSHIFIKKKITNVKNTELNKILHQSFTINTDLNIHEYKFIEKNLKCQCTVEEFNGNTYMSIAISDDNNTANVYEFTNSKLTMSKQYKFTPVNNLNDRLQHLLQTHSIADFFELSEYLQTKVFPFLKAIKNFDKSNIPSKDTNMTILYDIIEGYRNITQEQKQKNIITLIESLNTNFGFLKLINSSVNNSANNPCSYMKLMKSDQSIINVFYDIANEKMIPNNSKLHANINGTYVDCFETTNDKNEPVFYIIDKNSLSYHLNNAQLTYVGTTYHRDGYRGIYFEYAKPNGDKVAVFCYCNKRSRNIYHISYYVIDDKKLCQYSTSAVRDYKDIDIISTMTVKSTITLDNNPFYTNY